MELIEYRFDEVTINFDKKRVPLSGAQREKRQGEYRYYGAQGVIDHIDDFIFDGTYLLIAEDGENLKSKKQNIAQVVEGQFWVNNHAHIVQGNELCNTRYLCYLLNSMDLSGYITGSAQPKLSQANLNAVILLLPPIHVQDKIVEYLYMLDRKITINQQINDNLQQQAQTIYKSLFLAYDSTPTSKFYASELGQIPVGWTVKSLSEVTTSIRTKVKDNNYKVFSAINTGQLQLSEEYFTKQVFSKNICNYIVVEPFDFAYNPARVNIGSIGMNDFGYTGCVSPIYVVVRPEPEYQYFLDFFIKTKPFCEEVKARASGSVRQSLSYTDFGQIKVVYPPIEVIRQFNREYEVRLRAMKQLKDESKKLALIRDALLPKLMSDEIDVSAIQL